MDPFATSGGAVVSMTAVPGSHKFRSVKSSTQRLKSRGDADVAGDFLESAESIAALWPLGRSQPRCPDLDLETRRPGACAACRCSHIFMLLARCHARAASAHGGGAERDPDAAFRISMRAWCAQGVNVWRHLDVCIDQGLSYLELP